MQHRRERAIVASIWTQSDCASRQLELSALHNVRGNAGLGTGACCRIVKSLNVSSLTSRRHDASTEAETITRSPVACWIRRREQCFQQTAQTRQFREPVSYQLLTTAAVDRSIVLQRSLW